MSKALKPILFFSSFIYIALVFYGNPYLISHEAMLFLSIASLVGYITWIAINYKKETFFHKYLMVVAISVLVLMAVVYLLFNDFGVSDVSSR